MDKLKAIAVIVLGALEITAMLTGHDGVYFLPVVAAIAGLAGYEIGVRKYGKTERVSLLQGNAQEEKRIS